MITIKSNNSLFGDELSYTSFILNIRSLLKKKNRNNRQAYRLSYSLQRRKRRESEFFQALHKAIVECMDYSKVIEFLKKEKPRRTKQEIKAVADFLSRNNDFFQKFKNENLEDEDKLHFLVNVLNIEYYTQNEKIIKYGDDGNKMYIVLEGEVGVFKPKFVERNMTQLDFIALLHQYKENDIHCYYRTMKKNGLVSSDISAIIKQIDNDNPIYKNYFIETNEHVSNVRQGDSFGEVALLQKTKRTATIIALSNTYIASIDENDYVSLIRSFAARKYYGHIAKMKKDYIIISNWSINTIAKLISSFVTIDMIRGDFVYKQGEESNAIYFATEGNFDVYIDVNVQSAKALCQYINKKSKMNIDDVIEDMKCGVLIDDYYVNKHMEGYNDSNIGERIKVKIRKQCKREIFGVEDIIDMRKRYCSVICSSIKGVVKKISFTEVVKIIKEGFNVSIEEMNYYAKERKEIIIAQVLKSISLYKSNHPNKDISMNEITNESRNKTPSIFKISKINVFNIKKNFTIKPKIDLQEKISIIKTPIIKEKVKNIVKIINTSFSSQQVKKRKKTFSETQNTFTEMSTSYKNNTEMSADYLNVSKRFKKVENELTKMSGIFNTYRKKHKKYISFCPKLCMISPLRLRETENRSFFLDIKERALTANKKYKLKV